MAMRTGGCELLGKGQDTCNDCNRYMDDCDGCLDGLHENIAAEQSGFWGEPDNRKLITKEEGKQLFKAGGTTIRGRK